MQKKEARKIKINMLVVSVTAKKFESHNKHLNKHVLPWGVSKTKVTAAPSPAPVLDTTITVYLEYGRVPSSRYSVSLKNRVRFPIVSPVARLTPWIERA